MRKTNSGRGSYMSLILTFLMIFSSFADTGLVLKSYAADDEVIPEAVSEDETDEIVSEDEPAEETDRSGNIGENRNSDCSLQHAGHTSGESVAAADRMAGV